MSIINIRNNYNVIKGGYISEFSDYSEFSENAPPTLPNSIQFYPSSSPLILTPNPHSTLLPSTFLSIHPIPISPSLFPLPSIIYSLTPNHISLLSPLLIIPHSPFHISHSPYLSISTPQFHSKLPLISPS